MSVRVTVEFFAQLRLAAGTQAEEVDLPAGAGLTDLLALLAGRHGAGLRAMLLADDGSRRPGILTMVDGRMAGPGDPAPLADGSRVLFFSPVSGG